MGDRGHICIVDERKDGAQVRQARVYLYSHHGGWMLPFYLQETLRRLGPFTRPDQRPDAQHLSHRLYGEILRMEEDLEKALDSPWFGISGWLGDNEYPVLTVYAERRSIELHDQRDSPTGRIWTYDEFLRLSMEPEPWSSIAPEYQRFH